MTALRATFVCPHHTHFPHVSPTTIILKMCNVSSCSSSLLLSQSQSGFFLPVVLAHQCTTVIAHCLTTFSCTANTLLLCFTFQMNHKICSLSLSLFLPSSLTLLKCSLSLWSHQCALPSSQSNAVVTHDDAMSVSPPPSPKKAAEEGSVGIMRG